MKSVCALLVRLAHPTRPIREDDIAELNQCSAAIEALAAAHRVRGWLAFRLETAPPGIESRLLDRLKRARHRTSLLAARFRAEQQRILEALRSCDIPCIPLKGVDLAYRLYPDPGLRPFEDLDLLIPPDRMPEATAAMAALGYAIPEALIPSLWVRRIHFHLPFLHAKNQTFVELHWALADRYTLPASMTGQAWSTSAPGPAGAVVLAEDLYALYLLAHLAKHGWMNQRIAARPTPELLLHPWSDVRLIWLLDIRLLMDRAGLSCDRLIDHAQAAGIESEVRTSLALINCLLPRDPVALPTPRKEGLIERRIKDRLLRRMTQHLERNNPFPADLPWVLRPIQQLHIRPIRLFSHVS